MSKVISVAGPEIRAAAKFLERRKLPISPRRFAMAAKDLNTGFRSTLEFLGKRDDEGTDYADDPGSGEPEA